MSTAVRVNGLGTRRKELNNSAHLPKENFNNYTMPPKQATAALAARLEERKNSKQRSLLSDSNSYSSQPRNSRSNETRRGRRPPRSARSLDNPRRKRSGSSSKSNRSVGSSELDFFYSSRRIPAAKKKFQIEKSQSARSLGSVDSVSSLGSSVSDISLFTNRGGSEVVDSSPRRPPKRGSFTQEIHVVPPPVLGGNSDLAPKRPPKRTSISGDAAKKDIVVTPPREDSPPVTRQKEIHVSLDFPANNETKDVAPLFPKRAVSGGTVQGENGGVSAVPSSSKDISPRRPTKRLSMNNTGDSSTDSNNKNNKHEIYVSPPSSWVKELDGSASPSNPMSVPLSPKSSAVDEDTNNVDKKSSQSVPSAVPASPPPEPKLKSQVFQRTLRARRQASISKRRGSNSSVRSAPVSRNYTRSLSADRSIRSTRSLRSTGRNRRQESLRSIMSSRSILTLSPKVKSLLEVAAEVVNSDRLDQAVKIYHQSIHSAGSEIMDINLKMGKLKKDKSEIAKRKKASYHEDLVMIGIIIGLLRTKMAILYAEEGAYDQAINLCRGATQVHKHQPAVKVPKPELDETDQLASLMILIIERLENGQQCLEDHKELLEKIDLLSVNTELSNYSDDVSVATNRDIVFEMIERRASEDQSSVVTFDGEALDLLSVHAAEQDKHDQGIKFLRDALQIHLVALGLKHPSAGKSLIRVAKMYRGTGNSRENEKLVLGYFRQTASVLQRSDLGSRERGAILNDIAVIHMRRHDFEEAIKFLLDAVHAYEDDIVKIESACRTIGTLQVWRNLGECYMKVEKCKSAEGAFLKALDVQRDARRLHQAADGLGLGMIGVEKSLLKLINDTSFADTICRIGKARAAAGDNHKAIAVYKQALAILHRDFETTKNQLDRDLLEKRDQLTQTLYYIAESCNAVDDFEKSLRMFNLSIKLRNSNTGGRKDTRKNTRIHTLSCYIGIGDVYVKMKDFQKGIKQYKDALGYAVANRVRETHPVVKSIREKIIMAEHLEEKASNEDPEVVKLEKKADAEIERGALDQATETLKELLVIRRAGLKELKKNGQDTSEQVYAIACLLQTFGFVFAKNGDDENAERAFKDASRLFRKGGNNGQTPPTMCTI